MSSVSFLKAEKKNAKSISYNNIVHNPWGLIDQSTNNNNNNNNNNIVKNVTSLFGSMVYVINSL